MKQTLLKSILVVLTALLSLPALAYDFEVNGIYYSKISDGKTVAVTFNGNSYDKKISYYSGDVVIPAEVEYKGVTYSVTGIEKYAFYNCKELTSITIPDCVRYIAESAFYGCI